MIRLLYRKLAELAEREFGDVVVSVDLLGGTITSPNKLRLPLHDTSFLDVWLTLDGDYAYHWERRRLSGEIFRWDNAPHHREISTYPCHFHRGDEHTVLESHLPADPEAALRDVLTFARKYLSSSTS